MPLWFWKLALSFCKNSQLGAEWELEFPSRAHLGCSQRKLLAWQGVVYLGLLFENCLGVTVTLAKGGELGGEGQSSAFGISHS